MKDKLINPPAINADFKETGRPDSEGSEGQVITDEQFAALSESTNAEQLAKLRCWDIQEYIDGISAQKAQIEQALEAAGSQLEEAKNTLVESRTELRGKFDSIFGPLGLSNKVVSVSQTSPHTVTVHEAPVAEAEASEDS